MDDVPRPRRVRISPAPLPGGGIEMSRAARILARLLAAALVTVLFTTPAAAAVDDVVVGGILVLRVRTDAGGMTAPQRAAIVEQRTTNALSKTAPVAEAITVRPVRGEPVIFVGDIVIITVDANHARLNSTSKRALAAVWLRTLQEALPKAVPQPINGA